jgi:hypothetical protein
LAKIKKHGHDGFNPNISNAIRDNYIITGHIEFHYSTTRLDFIIKPVMERAVYRIIDANFNRAREAARVIEEFCRFALNSGLLTERAKQPRKQRHHR